MLDYSNGSWDSSDEQIFSLTQIGFQDLIPIVEGKQ
jgi:hypothetical protein